MRCPSCSSENAVGRKFCAECGTRLSSGCPSCGAANDPSAKFCGECGTSLGGSSSPRPEAASGPEPSGPALAERRIVSVLFADLVGFTALTEGRDPEQIRDLQERYFGTTRTIVERYGGTLEKYIGDAVMAVWGAPTAFEDDPERAVRAALDIVGAVAALGFDDGPRLVARAAVMTGDAAVTVGAVGQGMVSGELVSAASRLQGVAPEGGVLIDEATQRVTASAIASTPFGDQLLRGRSEPIVAWRPTGVIAMRGGGGRVDRLEPPFVGRDSDLRLLKDVLHAVDDESRARLVSVTGIAGIGKSRLAWELEKYIDGIVSDVYWHQGRSPAYGEGIAFWALAEMVRSRAGIAESEDAEATQTKLMTALAEYVPDDAERRTMIPWLLALFGLRETHEGPTEEAFAAARRLMERIAERGVAVFVFEDLQWADQGLIDFIESVLEWSRNHRILIVTLARPELIERRPTWGAGQRNFTALHLEPLPDASMTELLDGVAPGLPRPLVRRIVERAAGVPLFAVETIRMLVDDGRLVRDGDTYQLAGEVGELAVPESLRGLVIARLDGLDPDDRALIQDASVLGQTFTVDALATLAGRSAEAVVPTLRSLVRREILVLIDDPGSPERGQYGFVQGVIREVAYETLARKERRARHLAAARYFETLDSDELAGVLASHYLDAYRETQAGPEADALAAQARVALRGAADRATALGSPALAVDYLEKALVVTPDPADQALVHEAASAAAYSAALHPVAERHARAALEWYQAKGDPSGVARASKGVVMPYLEQGKTDEAIAVLEQALAATGGSDDDPAVVALVATLARVRMQMSDPTALELVDRALVTAERLRETKIVADALITKGGVLDTAGRLLEGMALTRGGAELAAANGWIDTQLRGRSNLANALFNEDPRAAAEMAAEARELARRLGNMHDVKWITFVSYGAGFVVGRWDWVLELAEDIEQSDPNPLDLEGIHGMRAMIAAYQGNQEIAEREFAVRQAIEPEASRPEFLAFRHADTSEIAGLAGRLDEAYNEAMTGLRIEPRVGIVNLASRWAAWARDVDRARAAAAMLEGDQTRGRYVDAQRSLVGSTVAALAGDTSTAVRGYRAAIETFRDLQVPVDLGIALMNFATLLGPGEPGTREAAAEARSIFEGLGAHGLITRLDLGLAAWPSETERSAARADIMSTAAEAGRER